jgi:anti-anti-sigma factor
MISMMAAPDATPPQRLTVSSQATGDGSIRVAAAGELDIAGVDMLSAAMSTAIDRSPVAILVDLDALTFMDSSGVATLIAAQRRANAQGVTFAVTNTRGIVRRVLELTGAFEQLTGHAPSDAGDW